MYLLLSAPPTPPPHLKYMTVMKSNPYSNVVNKIRPCLHIINKNDYVINKTLTNIEIVKTLCTI